MRIGIDIGKAVGRLDGIARTTRELVRALAAPGVLGANDQVALFGLFAPVAADELAAALPELGAPFRLSPRRRPAPGEVDVFHATTYSVPGRPGEPGAALVFTLYDLSFLARPGDHTLDNRLHCLRGLARALAAGGRLLAISEHTRAAAGRRLAVPAERVEVVYPGVEARFRPVAADDARRVAARHGLDGPYVLAVGTLEPRKNLAALFAAFAALPDTVRRDHRLAVAGAAGWNLEEPAALAAAAGLTDGELLWLGAVDDADLPALYSAAAAFVYPSLYEGFGLPPLEAMACGAPVVTSATTSLPEVVGDAALCVDPADPAALAAALLSVLTDRAWSAALREAGPERAARFTWERTARQTLAVYRRAVAEKGKGNATERATGSRPGPGGGGGGERTGGAST